MDTQTWRGCTDTSTTTEYIEYITCSPYKEYCCYIYDIEKERIRALRREINKYLGNVT